MLNFSSDLYMFKWCDSKQIKDMLGYLGYQYVTCFKYSIWDDLPISTKKQKSTEYPHRQDFIFTSEGPHNDYTKTKI